MTQRSAIRGLYALTPDLADTHALLRLVEAALRGGTKLVQYRNKDSDAALRLTQAQALQSLCAEHGALLIVNDFPALSVQVGAAGVHVGREDGGVTAARAVVGERLVGVSCYNDISLALEAQQGAADYVAFGSFFASSTKPNAVRASLELLRAARARLNVPIVAIGGITLDNAAPLIAAGADAIAVSSALFNAADIASAARCFNQLFEEHTHDSQ